MRCALVSFQCVCGIVEEASNGYFLTIDSSHAGAAAPLDRSILQRLKMDLCVNVAYVFVLQFFTLCFYIVCRTFGGTRAHNNVGEWRDRVCVCVQTKFHAFEHPVNAYVRISRECVLCVCMHAVTNALTATDDDGNIQVRRMANMRWKS